MQSDGRRGTEDHQEPHVLHLFKQYTKNNRLISCDLFHICPDIQLQTFNAIRFNMKLGRTSTG